VYSITRNCQIDRGGMYIMFETFIKAYLSFHLHPLAGHEKIVVSVQALLIYAS